MVLALKKSVGILWTRKLKLMKELCEAKPLGTERLLSELEGASSSSSPGNLNLPGTRDQSSGKTIFPRTRAGEGAGVGMSQALYTCCALYVCYYHRSSTSDHLALGPRGCGPLP